MVRICTVVSPAPPAAWADVLRADDEAVVSQTPEWLSCICAIGPWSDASRYYEFDDGRRVVLPLVRRSHLPGTAVVASLPYGWGSGGPLADGPVSPDHTRLVWADLLGRGALVRDVRFGPRTPEPWHAAPECFRRTEREVEVLDLTGGFGTVWSERFRSTARTAVRKAERSDLEVRVDRSGRLVGTFHELYRLSIDRWAVRQHEPLRLSRYRAERANPRRKFEVVAERLGDRCTVWVAYHRGRPAAGLIVLRHGRQASYWRGAMDVDVASPTRANNLLHRLAVEDACASGCDSYDMGESRPHSSLARFKTSMGATPCRTPSFHYERLPLTWGAEHAKGLVKGLIRFRDV